MGRSAANARKARRHQVLGGRPFALPPRCASCDGYTLHAGVVIGASNRKGLRQLCRYVSRPPLARVRLEFLAGDRVRLGMKRAWSDGTVAIDFSALELVERLASIVPPPGKNQVLYHGVLAARSAWRSQVVPGRRARGRPAAHCAPPGHLNHLGGPAGRRSSAREDRPRPHGVPHRALVAVRPAAVARASSTNTMWIWMPLPCFHAAS